MNLTVNFKQTDLVVGFDVEYPEPDVGFTGDVVIYSVEYGDCDIKELIDNLELMEQLSEATYEKFTAVA